MNDNFDWNEIDWEARHSGNHPVLEVSSILEKAKLSEAHPRIISMLEDKLNHEVELTNFIFSQSKRFNNFIND